MAMSPLRWFDWVGLNHKIKIYYQEDTLGDKYSAPRNHIM